jgi:hypothetical protein
LSPELVEELQIAIPQPLVARLETILGTRESRYCKINCNRGRLAGLENPRMLGYRKVKISNRCGQPAGKIKKEYLRMKYIMIGYGNVFGSVILFGPYNSATDEEAKELAEDFWKKKKIANCNKYKVFREIE